MNDAKDEFGFPNVKLMIEDILLQIIFKQLIKLRATYINRHQIDVLVIFKKIIVVMVALINLANSQEQE